MQPTVLKFLNMFIYFKDDMIYFTPLLIVSNIVFIYYSCIIHATHCHNVNVLLNNVTPKQPKSSQASILCAKSQIWEKKP